MTDFETIFQEFQPKIYRYLSSYVGEADAGDLTQTVFLKVSQSLGGFRGESSFATWIYRIATNTAHDHAASRAVTRKWELLLDADDASVDFPDDATLASDQEYIRREMNACIRSLIERLPENYRTVLLLSDFEGLKNNEIAEILVMSLDVVKIRLHRARTALRKAMESQCSLYYDERSELMCDRK